MKRLILVAAVAAGLTASMTSANAQTYGGAQSCAKNFKDFWQNYESEHFAKMSADQIADLSRTALRGYEACTAGDERFMADSFWKKLKAQGSAKASDIFNSDAFGPRGSPNAKK
jgi:hypothetical protein